MQVRMADPAIQDLNQNIKFQRIATFETEGLEGFCRSLGGVGSSRQAHGAQTLPERASGLQKVFQGGAELGELELKSKAGRSRGNDSLTPKD